MWTHADTMHTHADCPQKCGQMRTRNADTDVNTRTIDGPPEAAVIVLLVRCTICNHDGSTNFYSVIGSHLDQRFSCSCCMEEKRRKN